MPRLAPALLVVLAGAACGGRSPAGPSPAPPLAPAPGSNAELTFAGDPESTAGASWSLRGEVDGGIVDLHGEDHDLAQHGEVLARVRTWYAAHGVL